MVRSSAKDIERKVFRAGHDLPTWTPEAEAKARKASDEAYRRTQRYEQWLASLAEKRKLVDQEIVVVERALAESRLDGELLDRGIWRLRKQY
jgi:hypothetical protein